MRELTDLDNLAKTAEYLSADGAPRMANTARQALAELRARRAADVPLDESALTLTCRQAHPTMDVYCGPGFQHTASQLNGGPPAPPLGDSARDEPMKVIDPVGYATIERLKSEVRVALQTRDDALHERDRARAQLASAEELAAQAQRSLDRVARRDAAFDRLRADLASTSAQLVAIGSIARGQSTTWTRP